MAPGIRDRFRRLRDQFRRSHRLASSSPVPPNDPESNEDVVKRPSSASSASPTVSQLALGGHILGSLSTPFISTSSQATSSSEHPPDSRSETGQLKQRSAMAWSILETALSITKKASAVFPPLQFAAGGLLEVMQRIDTIKGTKEDFQEIANSFNALTKTLSQYQGKPTAEIPENLRVRMQKLSEDIDSVTQDITAKLQRGIMSRTLHASDDGRDIARDFRSLGNLMATFTFQSNIDLEIEMAKTRKGVDGLNALAWHGNKVLSDINITTANTQEMLQDMYKTSDLTRHAIFDKLTRVETASFMAQTADECMEGTRIDLLKVIMHWAQDPGSSKRVFWLSGMAGTGKSTVARTLCRQLDEVGLLAASFFCSRNKLDQSTAAHILPTVACNIALRFDAFARALARSLESHPDAAKYNMADQFRTLIGDPLASAFTKIKNNNAGVLVAVIDALDECSDKNAVEQLLSVVLRNLPHSPYLKFFVTGRPEPYIQRQLSSPNSSLYSRIFLQDIEARIIDADIRLYLQTRIHNIRRERDDISLPEWPPQRQIELLVERSERLFIYAFTAYAYIRDPEEDPIERLQTLTAHNDLIADMTMLDRLYEMYSVILNQVFRKKDKEKVKTDTLKALAALVMLRDTLCLSNLALLLEMHPGTLRNALRGLQSLINVPSDNDKGVVAPIHASFADYLTRPLRVQQDVEDTTMQVPVTVDPFEWHFFLLQSCLTTMSGTGLQFNVSRIKTSHLANAKQEEKYAIPGHLVYASRQWVHHFLPLDPQRKGKILGRVEAFLRQKFLFWLEIFSVIGKVPEALSLLTRLLNDTMVAGTSDIVPFLRDAIEFIVTYRDAIAESAPHIYLSALPFTRDDSLIATTFRTHFTRLPVIETLSRTPRGGEMTSVLQMDHGGTVPITSATFSPDGSRIVSSSRDTRVRIWNATTGECEVELKGHTDHVSCVAFSPDGSRIVSGSRDTTVRIWNTTTGESEAVLKGHNDYVSYVAFSPDGSRIVSSSDDNTVRIWNAATDESEAVLEGHTSYVSCVAFSPDGSSIVSSSDDNTVRIWNAATGECEAVLEGHTGTILSVAFSRDGRRIVSGSEDNTIFIWNCMTAEIIAGPFRGHSDIVRSVAYSPDSRHIVSGSQDQTLRIWDAETGEPVAGPCRGHSAAVNAVAFSPDGTRILSGSDDGSIRVWEADRLIAQKAISGSAEGHRSWVCCVSYSPDGQKIVSGSADGTLCIWDAATADLLYGPLRGHGDPGWVTSVAYYPAGLHSRRESTYIISASVDATLRVWDAENAAQPVVRTFEGHKDRVSSVALPPDGKLIVSGSYDKTVRIWDAMTGELKWKPLEGHRDWVRAVACDKRYIASGSDDKALYIWNIQTGERVHGPLTGHTGRISAVAISPNGVNVVTGSDDCTLRIWNADTGDFVRSIKGHEGWITSVAYSPDGKYIASGSGDRTLCIWDANSGELVLGPFGGHSNWVRCVAYAPSGNNVVLGCDNGTLRVWDTRIASPAIGTSAKSDAPGSEGDESLSVRPRKGKGSTSRDGWAAGPQGELLVWVPHHRRPGIMWPRTVAVMGAHLVTKVRISDSAHGNNWQSCFTKAK